MDNFESRLDELLRAWDRKVSRQYDAASCQTPHDRREAHAAEDTAEELREKFLSDFGAAVADVPRNVRRMREAVAKW
jgi:hypothetical protein